jgi:uncharacterized cupredoxin-like copper-binding protein
MPVLGNGVTRALRALMWLMLLAVTAAAFAEDDRPQGMHPALVGIDWAQATRIEVDLGDHLYEPDRITLHKGKPYKLTLNNVGRFAHDMVGGSLFDESVIALRMVNSNAGRVIADRVNSVYVRPKHTIELWLVPLMEGEYSFYCSLNGHREDGMEGTVTILP